MAVIASVVASWLALGIITALIVSCMLGFFEFEYFHQHIKSFVSEGMCKRTDDKTHVFAERIAWRIMNPARADWRAIPGMMAAGFVLGLCFPIQPFLKKH